MESFNRANMLVVCSSYLLFMYYLYYFKLMCFFICIQTLIDATTHVYNYCSISLKVCYCSFFFNLI
ncbi:hypothetical protein Hdeb2414_s0023g00641641 [Helianthus debilis subsp. tardiflorus]